MSAALQSPVSPEAFLAWESLRDSRYEFGGNQPVGTTGVTARHSSSQCNLSGVLFNIRTSVPLSELYEGVSLPPTTDEAEAG